jgi:hypothetical protein
MKSADYYKEVRIYIFAVFSFIFVRIEVRLILAYLLPGYQSQSTVLGAKSLLRPSFSSPSGSSHFRLCKPRNSP